jgi:MFS family permease
LEVSGYSPQVVYPSQSSGSLIKRNAILRALWIASMASSLAGMMQDTASAWLLAILGGKSPVLVTLMQTASSLPFFLFALPGGAMADVLDRRRLLVVAQTWRFVVAAALAILSLFGGVTAEVLIAATFAMSLGGTFTMPTWQAVFPEVVKRDEIASVANLSAGVTNFARGVGPALAGLLLGSFGGTHVFVINAGLMSLSLVLVLLWRREARKETLPAERLLGAMKAAVRYVIHAPAVETVLVRNVVFVFLATAPISLVPLIANQWLHFTGAEFGFAMAVQGLGGVVVATFVLPRICSRYSINSVVASATLLLAGAAASLAIVTSIVAFCVAVFVLGASVMCALASLNIAAQLTVPDWIRGRASSVYLLLVQGAFAVGALAWGYIGLKTGVHTALYLAAGGALLSLVLCWLCPLPQLARLNLSTSHHWPAFQLVTTLRPDDGPVVVQIDYEIEPASSHEFQLAMEEIRVIRLRDGGMRWVLLDDLGTPGHFREAFLVESWSEHLRQVERSTVDDEAVERRARAFMKGGAMPTVRHFLVGARLRS